VHLLEVPDQQLKQFKVQNKEKCDSDPLMPAFSPDMEYVVASKTHFTHGCKLAIEGHHHLYNDPALPKIRFSPDDLEGQEIMTKGVLAVIYCKSIWEDPEAVIALSSLGNFNAAIDQGEDEMQAFGRVNELFRRMVDSKQYEDMEDVCINAILEGVRKSSGFGHFSQSQWRDFIALRKSLTNAHTEVLIMCQFNSVSGRIRLKSSSYQQVSKLDKRCGWIKVGLMLYGYQISESSHTSDKAPKEDLAHSPEFASRSETYVKDLNVNSLQEL